eukprot:2606533-Pyramimonas_sp.AAC.1
MDESASVSAGGFAPASPFLGVLSSEALPSTPPHSAPAPPPSAAVSVGAPTPDSIGSSGACSGEGVVLLHAAASVTAKSSISQYGT